MRIVKTYNKENSSEQYCLHPHIHVHWNCVT